MEGIASYSYDGNRLQNMTDQETTSTVVSLSLWDQAAPRHYMSVVLCFPTDKHTLVSDNVVNHVLSALRRLVLKRPEYAGRLRLGGANVQNQSHVSLQISSSDYIPLDIFRLGFEATYAKLRDSSFSASTFVNPEFIISGALTEGGRPIPVSQIRIMFIDGGFFLFVYLHHTFADGSGMDAFLKDLAAETQQSEIVPGVSAKGSDQKLICQLDLPLANETLGLRFDQLLEICPEFGLLPQPTGPTQPILLPINGIKHHHTDNIGKIFVIDRCRLDRVSEWLQPFIDRANTKTRIVSRYFTLAALTWAHTCKARLATESEQAPQPDNPKPTFFNYADWASTRKGLFPNNSSVNMYFGNSVACVETKLDDTQDLVDACDWRKEIAQPQTSIPKLVTIVDRSLDANSCIQEDFVLSRTKLFQSAPDIRRLGVWIDGRFPQNFSFNTWMHVGSEAKFWFPGFACSLDTPKQPDAIRRVQPAWALTHGLILPRRGGGDDEIELLVTLPKAAMNCIEKDADWMSLVRRVID
jgi:hypothetical protein